MNYVLRNTLSLAMSIGMMTAGFYALGASCVDNYTRCSNCACGCRPQPPPTPPAPPVLTNCYVLDLGTMTVTNVASVNPKMMEYKTGKILFKLLNGGTYIAGSPKTEIGRYSQVNDIDFEPQHKVTVKDFAIGVYEVTQRQYEIVTGEPHQNKFAKADRAKDFVSWKDAHLFIDTVNKSLKGGWKIALPSEDQWEYACRAGTTNAFSAAEVYMKDVRIAPGLEKYASYLNGGDANVVRESVERFPPVGSFKPNPWGLYDMHGGVWEWCEDDWTVNGTKGMKSVRGGGYWFNSDDCRSANRHGYVPTHRNHGFGFRVVLLNTTK